VKLNTMSLAFTMTGIVFVLAALGAVVVVPVILNYVGLSNFADLLVRTALARDVRWRRAGAGSDLPLRPRPAGATVALDHVGERGCDDPLARRISPVLLVRSQFRQIQRNLRLAWRGYRLYDLAVDLRHRAEMEWEIAHTTKDTPKPVDAGAKVADSVGRAPPDMFRATRSILCR
jgi:membrane protein